MSDLISSVPGEYPGPAGDLAGLFSPGDLVASVRDAGRRGMVHKDLGIRAGMRYYQVFWSSSGSLATVAEADLCPVGDEESSDPVRLMEQGRFGGRGEFVRAVTFGRLARRGNPRNQLLAFNSSRSRFFPHQFTPLLKFLESPTGRMLIADEVGLGKTIEAGLILNELKARQDVARVLVACPSRLCQKWRVEMQRRFEEDFQIFDGRDLMEWLKEYEQLPERTRLRAIIGLESARADRVVARLEEVEPSLDLVIVDEAHHLRNFGRRTRKLGEVLARSADALLFLTATPVMLGRENLYSLFNLLAPDDFPDKETALRRFAVNEPVILAQNCFSRRPARPDEALQHLQRATDPLVVEHPLYRPACTAMSEMIENKRQDDPAAIVAVQRKLALMNLIGHVYTRTRRREVSMGTVRKAFAPEIRFSDHEAQFYNAVTDYVIELAEQQGSGAPLAWLLHMPQRRAASSIPAMVDHFRQKFATERTNELTLEAGEGEAEDWDEAEEGDGGEAHPKILQLRGSAVDQLRIIVADWRRDRPDSKYEVLRTSLTELRRTGPLKVLLFSFFKATLAYLQKRLGSDGFSCAVMTGDMKIVDRNDLMARFRDDEGLEILLLSNVGSEGLDLQFCNTMFNYDLPWNPMELEQRIGRIDRIGQKSETVNIYNLWVTDTIEERVLKRLLERIGIFRTSVGEIDDVVGEQFHNLERDIFSHRLTAEQQKQRAHQAELVLAGQEELMEQLEKESSRFLATEQFFQDEILRMRRRHGYVTPGQLRSFVEDFLSRECPGARLTYNNAESTGVLVVDSALAGKMQAAPEASGLWLAGSRIRMTFDGETAHRDPDLELINVLHPLVRTVVRHYEHNEALIGRAHSMVLRTDLVEAGFWFFFLYDVAVHASMEMSYLELVLVSEDLELVMSGEATQDLLAGMLEQGTDSLEGSPEVPADLAQDARSEAEEAITVRKNDLVREVQMRSDLFLRQQRASVEGFFSRKIGRLEELLERPGMSERVARLFRAQLARRRAEYGKRMNVIEERSRPAAGEYRLWGCGVLETQEGSHD